MTVDEDFFVGDGLFIVRLCYEDDFFVYGCVGAKLFWDKDLFRFCLCGRFCVGRFCSACVRLVLLASGGCFFVRLRYEDDFAFVYGCVGANLFVEEGFVCVGVICIGQFCFARVRLVLFASEGSFLSVGANLFFW